MTARMISPIRDDVKLTTGRFFDLSAA